MAPREMKVLDDFVSGLFNAPETAGAVELLGPVDVDSRVSTPSRPAPTTGTGIPGLQATEAPAKGVLLALSHSADRPKGFRTNIGVHNPDAKERTVTIALHRPDGTKTGEVTRTLPPSAPFQVSDVFGAAGITDDVPGAYAIVSGADSTRKDVICRISSLGRNSSFARPRPRTVRRYSRPTRSTKTGPDGGMSMVMDASRRREKTLIRKESSPSGSCSVTRPSSSFLTSGGS